MRELLVRDARAVPALDLLVVRDVVAELFQPGKVRIANSGVLIRC